VTSPESHFRNKAKLVVGGRATNPTLGILDPAGRGQDLRRCGLYEPGLAATFDPLHRFLSALALEPYDVPRRRGELKHVIVTHSPDGEHLVRFVVRSGTSARRSRSCSACSLPPVWSPRTCCRSTRRCSRATSRCP
jgi:tRNA/tmRNA/rRNA uracil-C5-methylase (TrmA/RlmC/RlmD family)